MTKKRIFGILIVLIMTLGINVSAYASTYNTSQTMTLSIWDDDFGDGKEGKYFVCNNSATYSINGGGLVVQNPNGSGGTDTWSATINASGQLKYIGETTITKNLTSGKNAWHLYWNDWVSTPYGNGGLVWEQVYVTPPTVDPNVTEPRLATSRDYNRNALQLITTAASSDSSGTLYYGLGTSGTNAPSDWSTSITDNKLKKTNQGTYYVWYKQDAATGYNAKAATYVGSVTINQKEVGLTWTNTNLTYNGQSQTPTATATGIISGDTCTVNITGGQTNYSASAYTATANSLSNSNYKLPSSKTTTFTIGQREVTLSWPANTTYPYNGKEQTPVATAGNLVSGDTCIVTVTGGKTNVGSNYTATASGLSNNNYKLPGSNKTCTFSISQAELTVTANNHTITYGDAPANSGVGYSGFQNGETAAVLGGTLTYSYNYEQYGNVGNSYTITPGGLTSSNYDIQFANGTLTVNPKSVTPSLTGAVSKVYDGTTATTGATTNLGISLVGVVNSDAVSTTFSSAAYGSANVGTGISVTASGIALTGTKAGNYTLSATSESANVGEITTRPITITATNQDVVLNGSITDYATDNTMVSISGDGIVTGETVNHTLASVTLMPNIVTTSAGTGKITPSGAVIKSGENEVTGNYNITYTDGVLTVGKAGLTVATAPSATGITYGQTLADSRITGAMKYVNTFDNTETDITGTFTWDDATIKPTVADSDKTEYAYTFTPTDSANYTNYKGKLTLTVAKAEATETAPTAKALTYNGQAQELVNAGSTSDGTLYYAVTTENVKPTDESLYTTSIPAKTDAGTYYVWYKVIADANHNDSEPVCIKVVIQSAAYAVLKVDNADHTIGSGQNAVITVKRSAGDDRTFSLYTGAAMDGTPIASGNCDTAPGSLILTLKSFYLDSLSVGDHKLTISFQDGSVDTTVKILPAAPTPTPKPVPKTGDSANPALWLAMMLVALIGFVGLAVTGTMKASRKKK